MIGGFARGGLQARPGRTSPRGLAPRRIPARPRPLAGRHIHGRAGRGLDVVGVEVRRLSLLAGTRLHGRPPRGPGSIRPGATGTRRFRRRPTRPRICCRPYRQQPRTVTRCAHGSSPPRRHIAMTRPDRQSGTIRPEFSRNQQIARSRRCTGHPLTAPPSVLPGRPGPSSLPDERECRWLSLAGCPPAVHT